MSAVLYLSCLAVFVRFELRIPDQTPDSVKLRALLARSGQRAARYGQVAVRDCGLLLHDQQQIKHMRRCSTLSLAVVHSCKSIHLGTAVRAALVKTELQRASREVTLDPPSHNPELQVSCRSKVTQRVFGHVSQEPTGGTLLGSGGM